MTTIPKKHCYKCDKQKPADKGKVIVDSRGRPRWICEQCAKRNNPQSF